METDNQRREREVQLRERVNRAGNGESPTLMVGVGRTPEEAARSARPLSQREQLEQLLNGTYDKGEANSVSPPGYEDITLKNIDQVFRYQTWNPDQAEAGDIVREALIVAGKAILRHVPPGGFRDEAIKLLVDTRMKANAAISFNGRF